MMGRMAKGTLTPYYRRTATRDEYLAFHYPETDPLPAFLGPRCPPLSDRYPFAEKLWPARRALTSAPPAGITFDLAGPPRGDQRRSSRMLLAAAVGMRARNLRERDHAFRTRSVPFPDGAFDTVVALNLIDRVPDPARALDEAARVTAPKGLLLVGSPYTWKEEFTPRSRWLGPVGEGGAEVRERLGGRFAREAETEMLFFHPAPRAVRPARRTHIQVFRRQS
jgi:SAM-dependent methyltransferase